MIGVSRAMHSVTRNDWRLPAFRAWHLAVAAIVLASLAAILPFSPTTTLTKADTQYGPDLGDPGKTYQNNPATNCRWWDNIHTDGSDPCFKGIWSDTTSAFGSSFQVKVNEYAEHHDLSCYGELCVGIYVWWGAYPATSTNWGYATVNHYCGGWPYPCSGPYPINVRGYAHHWNLTVNPSTWWTTSDGY